MFVLLMTKKYTQLQPEQRYQIEGFLKVGKTISEIGILLSVHKSTISRELSRNIPGRGRGAGKYKAVNAQKKTLIRHRIKP
jgi:IS30 family transposase